MNELKYFFLKTLSENKNKKHDDSGFFELVKNRLAWKEYLTILSELERKGFFNPKISNGLSEYGNNILKEWELFFTQKKKDEIAERIKLHNESLLSEWQVKTFWFVFIFGLLGGLYSTFDFFITTPKNEERFQQIEGDILKYKDTIKELRTLILTKKKGDSLNHSNSESNK